MAAVAVAEPSDDLTQLNGIGPRIASILNDGGITSYNQLQHANTGELRQIIATGGALPPASLDSWPTQATYAAKGDWSGLAAYQQALTPPPGRGNRLRYRVPIGRSLYSAGTHELKGLSGARQLWRVLPG